MVLEGVTSSEAYERWLGRKAITHVKRDRARGHDADGTMRSFYKEAIHAAVLLSGGQDAYTGEQLNWHLISKYNNVESKLGRHAYTDQFALLPSVTMQRSLKSRRRVRTTASDDPRACARSSSLSTRRRRNE